MSELRDLAGLRDDEWFVEVRRSSIDAAAWYLWSDTADQTDWECPGRLRRVQAHAAGRYADGRRVRWVRISPDIWQMRTLPD